MCGAFSDCQSVKPGGKGRKSLPLVFASFCRLTGQDRLFWAADGVLSAAFCYAHFRDDGDVYKRQGLIYVDRTDDDVKELKRYPKDSYYWYQKVIATNGASIWED